MKRYTITLLAVLLIAGAACGPSPTTPQAPEPPTVYPPPPTIAQFEPSDGRTARDPGERLQLNWVVTQVKSVIVDDGTKTIYTRTTPDEKTSSVSILVNPGPIAPTTYTLTAANDWGTVKATIAITIK